RRFDIDDIFLIRGRRGRRGSVARVGGTAADPFLEIGDDFLRQLLLRRHLEVFVLPANRLHEQALFRIAGKHCRTEIAPFEIPAWRSANGWSHAAAVGVGVVAVLPLLVLLVVFDRHPPRWLAPLSEVVEGYIVPLLARLSLVEFLLLSLAAGIGEELFFRGF